jgi:hypothetical protein
MVHHLEPVKQLLGVTGPVLANKEGVIAAFPADGGDPVCCEAFAEVLDCVQAEALEAELFCYPDAPVFDVFDYVVVVIVD